MVVRLSWLSGRALAAEARGVLGSTSPGMCSGNNLWHFFSHGGRLVGKVADPDDPLLLQAGLEIPCTFEGPSRLAQRVRELI